jgi:hypothetical protein
VAKLGAHGLEGASDVFGVVWLIWGVLSAADSMRDRWWAARYADDLFAQIDAIESVAIDVGRRLSRPLVSTQAMGIVKDGRSRWATRGGDDFLAQIETAESVVGQQIDRQLSGLISGSRIL